jgi:hypothetical protein
MLSPVSIRSLILCFSIASITWGSSAFTVVTGAWMGGPGTCHWWEALALVPLGTKDSVPSNDFSGK